jgi:hypothetical protein
MFVSFGIHITVKPYKETVLDRLETLSMAGSVLTLWIGLFFYLGTPLEVEVILTIVLCIFNALLCMQFALSIVKEFLRARVMNSMPTAGMQDGGVSEDAVSEYIILFWWCVSCLSIVRHALSRHFRRCHVAKQHLPTELPLAAPLRAVCCAGCPWRPCPRAL